MTSAFSTRLLTLRICDGCIEKMRSPMPSSRRVIFGSPAAEAAKRQRELLRLQRKIAKKRRKALHGQEIQVLVEGESDESEYLLQGRHAGQAPEIDGQVYLTLGESVSELALRPGDLVGAVVRSSAEYDLAAEVVRVLQPAYRPPQSVKLRVVK